MLVIVEIEKKGSGIMARFAIGLFAFVLFVIILAAINGQVIY